MRVKVHFESESGKLPRDYRQVMLSFLKSALTEYQNGSYFDCYFAQAKQKPFSFALLLPRAKFEGKFVHFESSQGNKSSFSMLLTCGNSETLLNLVNALLEKRMKDFLTAAGKIRLLNIEMLPNYSCKNREVFKLVSPLCIREHNPENNKDRFYSCQSAEWNEKLMDNLRHQYSSSYGSFVEDLRIRLINPRKTVIEVKGVMIEATLGHIELEGEPRLIQELYDNGIGSKTTTFGLMA